MRLVVEILKKEELHPGTIRLESHNPLFLRYLIIILHLIITGGRVGSSVKKWDAVGTEF